MSLTVTQNAGVLQFVYRQTRSRKSLLTLLKWCMSLYALVVELVVSLSLQDALAIRLAIPQALLVLLSDIRQREPRIFIGLCGLTVLWLYICYTRPSAEESLIVMRSVGVQTTTHGTSHFIPLDAITDIVIHEGFVGFGVKFYLAILQHDGSIEVVFPESLPQRRDLERVWRQTRKALFEE